MNSIIENVFIFSPILLGCILIAILASHIKKSNFSNLMFVLLIILIGSIAFFISGLISTFIFGNGIWGIGA